MDSIDNQITIKQVEVNHLKEALNCFTDHGLQESLSTLEAFFECDPKAFYVAIDKKENKVIGVCGAPVTTHNSGALGLYSVHKDFQKRGIGKKVFNLCMKHIGDRNCGLDAVPDKLKMYQDKAGFKFAEGVSMVVFKGVPKNVDNLLKTINENTKIESFDKQNEELMTKIIEYDSKVHKESRKKLLSITLNKSDYKTFVAINQNNDQLVGYGCIRPNNSGKGMIGPVYADNDTVAEVLIHYLIKSFPEALKGLQYLTTSNSLGGIRIGQKLQIPELARCERLFTKHAIPVDYQYIYCIHSPNFSL